MCNPFLKITSVACVTLLVVFATAVSPARSRSIIAPSADDVQERNVPEQPGFYCNPQALNAIERQRHHELTVKLEAARLETKELLNGYALRFSNEGMSVSDLAEWVSRERRCCPFFDFTIELQRDDGPLWLKLTGKDGIKPFIKNEFNL